MSLLIYILSNRESTSIPLMTHGIPLDTVTSSYTKSLECVIKVCLNNGKEMFVSYLQIGHWLYHT